MDQGCRKADVYLVRRGLIKLQSINGEGQETIVGVRRSGCLIGGHAAMLRQASLVSAVTVTDCCLHRFPAAQFRKLISKHAALSWRLHQIIAAELQEVTTALIEMKLHSAEIRLKRLLLELVPELADPVVQTNEIRVPFKQWEISQMVGITPEHLSRLLRRLEKEVLMDRRVTFVSPEGADAQGSHLAGRKPTFHPKETELKQANIP